MSRDLEVEGFIIMGPGQSMELASATFGRTKSEAWAKHCGPHRSAEDIMVLRHRWAQRGWRPIPTRIIVVRE